MMGAQMNLKARQALYADDICRGARNGNVRTGQYLFNHLPYWATNAVAASLWDPFHKNYNSDELYYWIDNHLIFDDNGWIIAVFDGDKILAVRPEEI